ncbi:MAG: hypothetical protein IKD79_01675, partial [Oscillospiraceae bacterium]|nr:hypothetical protein [Oscillospiraceae bacterium]
VANEMKWNGSSNGWLSGIGAGIAAVTNAMRWDGAGYGTVSGVAAGIKSFEDQIPWYEKLLYHFKAVIDQYSNNGNQLASGGVFTGGAWRAIQSYASGGYVGGQLFVAREAGPELVGTLKGHTAVMNNDQIVSSVAAGVARAISSIRFQLAGLPAYPAVTPGMMPAMAAGTVIPPGILRSEEDIGGIRDAVGRILDRLEGLNAGGTGDISVNARVRERTLFEVVIEQGRLYKARTGRSPFDV